MTRFELQLTIDFGGVGYRDPKEPFIVRLDAAPLVELLEDAAKAHRVYELMLIDRPGDIWLYVNVVPVTLPKLVLERIECRREQTTEDASADGANRPFRFTTFDSLFTPPHWDSEPKDDAWGEVAKSTVVHDFARQLLVMAKDSVVRIAWNDPLIAHVVASVREGRHSFHMMDRSKFRHEISGHGSYPQEHSADFYKKLRDLLRHPEIASVAYRARGDYSVLRAMATEQRRRAEATGHVVGHALHLSALTDLKLLNEEWDSTIWFFSEGLAHGDLRIEGRNEMGASVSDLIFKHRCVPGRFLLSHQDEGDIQGFSKEIGDGFVLYTREQPLSRRMAIEAIHFRRRPSGTRVLSFAPDATVYSYDKTLILIGESVEARARELLAQRIAPWQADGGDIVLLVEGDPRPFDVHGCKRVAAVSNIDPSARRKFLWQLLNAEQRSCDVVISLLAPEWITERIHNRHLTDGGARPSQTWVVGTPATPDFPMQFELSGDISDALEAAIRRSEVPRD